MPAQNLNVIGVTALRSVTTNLNGAGIRVAQPEAAGANDFEVNPAVVGQPTNLFTYTSSLGSTNIYPNSVGTESGHGNGVAQRFYGFPDGVATNVAHVNNFDANFYYTNYIADPALPTTGDEVVNQSFTFGALTTSDQQTVDSQYDDYAQTNNTLFISAVDNGGNVHAPGTSYNCIGVGGFEGASFASVGPTIDNGRCKPDIVGLSTSTSFTTPLVSGAAALLMQAARRGDGGGDTNSAADMRVVKALLLNGALKPAGWTNSSVFPLDARYGAGVLNVFNSYRQLAGGQQNICATNLVSPNAEHPPLTNTNTILAHHAWDFGGIASGATNDAVNHYFFNVSNVIFNATLVWNRQFTHFGINDLDLFLYRCGDSNLVAGSISYVNNVEHLWVTNLPAGRYDLQVVKYGGTNVVSDAETYALAWEFVPPPVLAITNASGRFLNWPAYPAAFVIESRTNLLAGSWSTNGFGPPAITNGVNSIPLNTTNAARFFRLKQWRP